MISNGINQMQMQKQVQDELIYIVREDTKNFIGILFETLAVYNYFKDPQHQMCQTFKNRLITQINLSNAIYYEQLESGQQINSLKLEAVEIIKKLINNVGLEKSGEFKDLIDHHLNNNLANMNGMKQIELNFNQEPAKLSDVNVQKIVNSMNHQDQQFNKLSQGQMKCSKITLAELSALACIKYTEAVDKLKKNFKLEVDVPSFDKMKTEFSNNPNSGGQNIIVQQQNEKQFQQERQTQKLTQLIVQKWIDAAQDPKIDLKTTYNNMPKEQWQNILAFLKQNNKKGQSSDQIEKIISSIEKYQQNNKVIKGPEKVQLPLTRLEQFNQFLKDQIQ